MQYSLKKKENYAFLTVQNMFTIDMWEAVKNASTNVKVKTIEMFTKSVLKTLMKVI